MHSDSFVLAVYTLRSPLGRSLYGVLETISASAELARPCGWRACRPSGLYACRDGRVAITCPSQKFFVKLCQALERDWVADERFATIEARKANEEELDALIDARCRDYSRQELVDLLVAGDVLIAPINTIPDVVGMKFNEEHNSLDPTINDCLC